MIKYFNKNPSSIFSTDSFTFFTFTFVFVCLLPVTLTNPDQTRSSVISTTKNVLHTVQKLACPGELPGERAINSRVIKKNIPCLTGITHIFLLKFM